MKKNLLIGIIVVIVIAAAAWFFLARSNNLPGMTTGNTINTNGVNPYEGKTVSVDYIGTFTDGQVFDTSLADVAKKNGLYVEGKAYAPLTFVVGSKSVIAGFDKAVGQIKKVGDTTKVTIAPEDAYGAIDQARIVTVDRGLFQEGNIVPVVGQKYQLGGQVVTVLEVAEKTVKIDANHPMAGKTLQFEVTLRDVK